MITPACYCTTNRDGSVTSFHCPTHADTDPCLTMARVTGRRRTGTIRRGVCTACGHGTRPPTPPKVREYRGVLIFPRNDYGMYSARVNVPGGGKRLAADTLAGMRELIRYELQNGASA